MNPVIASKGKSKLNKDSSVFNRECWARGAGCQEDAMLVAEDQLSVRPDIHDRDEALFMRQIDGQQGVR